MSDTITNVLARVGNVTHCSSKTHPKVQTTDMNELHGILFSPNDKFQKLQGEFEKKRKYVNGMWVYILDSFDEMVDELLFRKKLNQPDEKKLEDMYPSTPEKYRRLFGLMNSNNVWTTLPLPHQLWSGDLLLDKQWHQYFDITYQSKPTNQPTKVAIEKITELGVGMYGRVDRIHVTTSENKNLFFAIKQGVSRNVYDINDINMNEQNNHKLQVEKKLQKIKKNLNQHSGSDDLIKTIRFYFHEIQKYIISMLFPSGTKTKYFSFLREEYQYCKNWQEQVKKDSDFCKNAIMPLKELIPGKLYLMPLGEGDLYQLTNLTETNVFEITNVVFEAIKCFEKAGTYYHDIKPSNCVFRCIPNTNNIQILVVDLGSAVPDDLYRIEGEHQLEQAMVTETSQYISTYPSIFSPYSDETVDRIPTIQDYVHSPNSHIEYIKICFFLDLLFTSAFVQELFAKDITGPDQIKEIVEKYINKIQNTEIKKYYQNYHEQLLLKHLPDTQSYLNKLWNYFTRPPVKKSTPICSYKLLEKQNGFALHTITANYSKFDSFK